MRELDDALRQIVRKIGRIETVIIRQRALISKLEHRGEDATRAKELLLQFADLRDTHIAERDRLLGRCKEA